MSTITDTPWEITGAEKQAIIGNTHCSEGEPSAVVLFVHGFLGYKDYGMFPYLAHHTASHGYASLRFNLSHSGMTNRIETFERPDLFEKDTWSKQVFDVMSVMSAAEAGRIPGCPAGLPCILYGHSRGGVTVLLTSGRLCAAATGTTDQVGTVDPLFAKLAPPAAVVTAAAPSFTYRLSPGQKEQLAHDGFVEVVSNRTGQTLRIDRGWLDEQIEHPQAHDLSAHVKAITCPLTIVHGERDPTVPASCAHDLLGSAGGVDGRTRQIIVPGADHVFNTPNPMPLDAEPSAQLAMLCQTVVEACHHAVS
ncbi:MAG: alpha/beta hydrolase [Planctomycetes bacterium]|nr:alpha/beta hydrolase [Planctomycetota bacterium]